MNETCIGHVRLLKDSTPASDWRPVHMSVSKDGGQWTYKALESAVWGPIVRIVANKAELQIGGVVAFMDLGGTQTCTDGEIALIWDSDPVMNWRP